MPRREARPNRRVVLVRDDSRRPSAGTMRRSSSARRPGRKSERDGLGDSPGASSLALPAAVEASEKAAAAVGTCRSMCPPAEFALRQRLHRLHRLELGAPPHRRPDPRLAVKEYSRPAAGKPPPRPDELRPPDVLLDTAGHLLRLAGEEEEEEEEEEEGGSVSASERGAFVADRLRAVRLDLTLQRLSGPPAAAVLERAVAALLHAGHRLCHEPPARFDAHLHRAHLQETLAALRRAYRDGEGGGGGGDGPRLPSQPRFQALFLLYNLGSADALWQILQLPKEVRDAPELSTAVEIHWAYLERNFARFFRLARELPYLPSCALHPHLGQARRLALLVFSHGFSARNGRYPLARLAQLLAADDPEEMAELCQAHGLAVTGGCVLFQKGAFKDVGPQAPTPSRLLVGGKRGKESLLELLEKMCH